MASRAMRRRGSRQTVRSPLENARVARLCRSVGAGAGLAERRELPPAKVIADPTPRRLGARQRRRAVAGRAGARRSGIEVTRWTPGDQADGRDRARPSIVLSPKVPSCSPTPTTASGQLRDTVIGTAHVASAARGHPLRHLCPRSRRGAHHCRHRLVRPLPEASRFAPTSQSRQSPRSRRAGTTTRRRRRHRADSTERRRRGLRRLRRPRRAASPEAWRAADVREPRPPSPTWRPPPARTASRSCPGPDGTTATARLRRRRRSRGRSSGPGPCPSPWW